MLLLVPLADEVAAATENQRAALFEQADTLQDAWIVFGAIAGLPMTMALWILAVATFRTRMIPRWMGVITVLLGLCYAPPLAGGENPLTPPLLLVFTVGSAYILLRRPPVPEPRAASAAGDDKRRADRGVGPHPRCSGASRRL